MRALAFHNGRPAFRVTSSRRVASRRGRDVRYVRQNAPVTVVPAPEGHVATFPFWPPNPRQPRDALHQVDLTAGISRVGGCPASSPSPKSLRELSSLPTSYFIYANVVVAIRLAINAADTLLCGIRSWKLKVVHCPCHIHVSMQLTW